VLRDALKPDGVILIETAVLLDANSHAMLYCPIGNESPYEPTSCTFFNEKGLLDTLASLGFRAELLQRLESEGGSVPGTAPTVDAAPAKPLPVGRATFRCTLESNVNSDAVRGYWESIHTLETAGYPRDR
jgi:hypothetical protein